MPNCPTKGCPGPGPDWIDQGPDPGRSVPVPCTVCGARPEIPAPPSATHDQPCCCPYCLAGESPDVSEPDDPQGGL